jgi:2-desacetyl-2-hydroxyethyl bacteriochlorophyllide A dehydrogenase
LTTTESTFLSFRKPYSVAYETVPTSPLGPSEVMVDTSFSAISAGTELLLFRGEMPENTILDDTLPGMKKPVTYPLRYGYATVGTISKIGCDIDPNVLTRKIFGFLPHGTHHIVKVKDLTFLPDDIDEKTACLTASMETAIGLTMDAAPIYGERLALFGLGVVGLMTAKILARFPLEHLSLIEPQTLRLDFAKEWICSSTHCPIAYLSPNQLDLNQDQADLILEISGQPEALDAAMEIATKDGRIVVGSWYGTKPQTAHWGGHFHRKRLKIISSQVSYIKPELSQRFSKRRRLGLALNFLSKIDSKALISDTIPFNRASDAYSLLSRGKSEARQILLSYSPPDKEFGGLHKEQDVHSRH